MSSVGFLESIWQDARYLFRTTRARPLAAATAVITLALAIGGTTAMFTIIRAVLLKPLAYRDPEKLVRMGGATPLRFAEMRAGAHSFTDIGAFTFWENVTLSGGTEPEVLGGAHVSAAFLRILGIEPLRGRGFRPEEDLPGGAPVAMISAELWQRRFGSDPNIVGKTALLADAPYTIVGVLPSHFRFPFADVDIWMTGPSEWNAMPSDARALSPFLTLFGRLRQGVSLEQANTELKVIRRRYAMAHPAMLDAKPQSQPEVTSFKEDMVGDVRSILWILFGAAGFVQLIACANIAGLELARAATRSREFAVRAALGAARVRIIRQLVAESVLFSLTGGLLGVLLAAYSLRTIPKMSAFVLPRAPEVHLDWIVLAFAASLSIATGVLFGLAPSLGASRPDLIAVLRTTGAAANAGVPRRTLSGWNTRNLLLIGQVALSIVLLIGAALLIESVAKLRHVDVGFNPANLLKLDFSLPPVRYNTDQKTASFGRNLAKRVESLPDVRAAVVAWYLPMMGSAGTPVQDAAKPPLPLNQRPIATLMTVTPGYFHTLGIQLRRGREFVEQDVHEEPRVAIIDEGLARLLWPAYPRGEDPIGQRIFVGGLKSTPAEIVGIAANVRQGLEGSVWPGCVYVSFAQEPQRSAVLAVRTTTGNPLSLTKAIRGQVRALDPDQTVAGVQTMDDLLEEQVGQRRLLMKLLESFAGMALLLALIGIYGVIAYSVAQRTQEVGIRRALGAQQGEIVRLMMRQGFLLALAGTAIGVIGAGGLTRVMETLLFNVSATDPAIFAGIAVLFLLVALVASYFPARRAAAIDPMTALRM